MGQNSKIEWTHHTANTWWGCQKVSPGCANCYAETLSKRYGHTIWGGKETSRRMMKSVWNDVKKWAVDAAAAGERRRVFWGSMMDVCEDRPELVEPRKRFCGLIEELVDLDFLILTKRPENYIRLMPWGSGKWPFNAWALTSVENQVTADKRIPELLKVRAGVHGLSVEPLLESLVLETPGPYQQHHGRQLLTDLRAMGRIIERGIQWMIVGGESGPGARPMQSAWVRSIRDQCQAAGVPFFFKQWGEWLGGNQDGARINGHQELNCSDKPIKVGKVRAGRYLDGILWDQMPKAVKL